MNNPAPNDADPLADLYGYSEDDLERVRQVLSHDEITRSDLLELVGPLHAADLADLIEQLPGDERHTLVKILGHDLDSEALSYLDYGVRVELVSALAPEKLAAILLDLESDDAIDIIEDLEESEQDELLKLVSAKDRAVFEQGLSYPEDSAGRLMRREVVTVPNFWTVGQSIDYLRGPDTLPDNFHSLIIVGPNHKPVGQLMLDRLLRNRRGITVASIMEREPKLIPVEMDQEDVAFLFRQYGLIEAPVVDSAGRLIGVITIDDIVDVIHEEGEEDLLSMAGVSADDFYTDTLRTARARLPWLLINLGTSIAASLVIGLFSDALAQLVALAILMPIVASIGGNVGSQALAVAVRALASNELTRANGLSIVIKEAIVGGGNGLVLAFAMGLIAWAWFQSPLIGAVIAMAMIINLTIAGLAGVLIPVILNRAGKDPAISSSVFLFAITDIVGFLSFLGLASLII